MDNINFGINQGELIGYIGPNGAGKSTTLRILAGLIDNYEGEVLYRGRSIQDIDRNILGYMPQDISFPGWKTVKQTLEFYHKLFQKDKNQNKNRKKRVSQIMRMLAIEDYKNKKVKNLSGGLIQILGFAQAILHDPDILILDEPLTGLDPKNRYKVKKILKKLNRNNKTIIFSSHILSDIEDLTKNVIILNDGSIINKGNISELYEEVSDRYEEEIVTLYLNQGISEKLNIDLKEGIDAYNINNKNRIKLTIKHNYNKSRAISYFISELLKLKYKIKYVIPEYWNLEKIYNRLLFKEKNEQS